MSKLKYSVGHIAATHDENPPVGGVLHLMGSLFLEFVQKKYGTGATSDYTGDRNLISYSGIESLWDPTG